MAILPDVPGIEVRVKVEGELDPDYENTDAKAEVLQPPNHPTSHFYVEAKTDARYFVQINLNEHLHAYLRTKHKSATHLGVALIVDGAMACLSGTGRFVEKHRREKTCEMRHTTWKSCGVWEYRDLVFNSVLIANALDAEEIQENIGRAPRIGLIQAFVFVNPGTITSVPLFQEARRQERELRSRANRVLGLTEKSMKGLGLSHASSLHNESTTKRYRPGKYPDGEIICEFRFSYRSKETLHSLGIIPRPGSKMPNFSGMTREELLSLAERNWRTLGDEEDRKPLAHSNRAVKTEPRGSTPGQDPLQLTAVRKRKRVEVDLTED